MSRNQRKRNAPVLRNITTQHQNAFDEKRFHNSQLGGIREQSRENETKGAPETMNLGLAGCWVLKRTEKKKVKSY